MLGVFPATMSQMYRIHSVTLYEVTLYEVTLYPCAVDLPQKERLLNVIENANMRSNTMVVVWVYDDPNDGC